MACSYALVMVTVFWFCLVHISQQLQSSQEHVLQQLRKQLDYPKQLDSWNYTRDICSTPSSPFLVVTCEQNYVTELKIVGDKVVKISRYEGYSVPSITLSQDFSVDSFVTTLSRLTTLKIVILVSLGIWGPLPDKINRLYSLEVLDLSSNFLYGSIPPRISAMGMLHSLMLDGNFFNSTLPDWFNSLSNLTILSLKNNQLKGPLPKLIGSIKTLTTLALSGNQISGELPDLSGLHSLEVLDLRENGLDSELPVMPRGLVTILLSRNSFSGEIPLQIGELNRLQHLDLSFNSLHGTLPAALFSLPNISYLNLASNMLTGSLPIKLTCSSQLGFVDISTNRLRGGLPSCLNSSLNKIAVNFSGNCLSVNPKHQHNSTYCEEVDTTGRSKKGIGGVLIGAVVGASIIVLLFLLVFCIFCRSHCQQAIAKRDLLQKPVPDNSPTGFSSELLANARHVSQTVKLGTQVLPTYRVFYLQELKDATNNFNKSTYIGEGSTGKIYKGRLENGTYVAIKCLALFKRHSIRNLKLRLELLSKLRHPHLVCLLGHCIDDAPVDSCVNRVFLVYEYITNGNLRAHLSESNLERALKWSDRLAVLMGIAKAVHFLHAGIIPGFCNNRLKTNNILLDEHCMAKLSDYGLSIITEEIGKHQTSVEGQQSFCGIQSKSASREVTNLEEDDVYLLGYISLETLVGPSMLERGESFLLNEMGTSSTNQDEPKRIIDPIVLGTSSHESLSIVISITKKCLSPESSNRPSIEDVLWNLQYAAQVQAMDDGDQRSDTGSQT